MDNLKYFSVTRSLIGVTAVILAAYAANAFFLKRSQKKNPKNMFKNPKIFILSSDTENLDELAEILKKHTQEFPVLGFDCEWITVGKRRNPVALLQISTHRQFAFLIRHPILSDLPKAFKEILSDDEIIKVGVSPIQDARYLYQDYALEVNSCLDLRFLAGKGYGLGTLAKKYLNFTMDKNWRIRCSNWEAEYLTDTQVVYAAQDVLVALEIYKKLIEIDNSSVTPYLDVPYSSKPNGMQSPSNGDSVKQKPQKIPFRNSYSTRKTPLYDNCYLEAPDGELLCTCDRKKAQWYVFKNIATIVSEQPFTVRLLFEPSGRAVGEVGEYYKTPKDNKCVCCGRLDSYNRKNIVPREYRKYFPVVVKEHSSHDVLLLCVNCHQKSNISDLSLRNQLAQLCDAPIDGSDKQHTRFHDQPALRELSGAARTLVRNGEKLPDARRNELQNIILKYFPGTTELTSSMLNIAESTTFRLQNEMYEPHGKKVVQYFIDNIKKENDVVTGGIAALEQMWRKHFVKTMQPKYLPTYWSIDHNKSRLEIRAEEGRIDVDDLRAAGCDEAKFKPKVLPDLLK